MASPSAQVFAREAATATSAMDGRVPEEEHTTTNGRSLFILSLLLCILIGVFFRSILPRLPRLVLRGRLRVKRLGLRGVRGIEWRSNGFKSRRQFNGQAGDGLVASRFQLCRAAYR
ncbi:hypothetical protein CBOM_00979 [Ceraceosorus bombacis]|uniref:Uncharacterized protein n=1 Tax=Ceraceosorus bombacis TaxID=401625 RepID=A0A0P1BAG2_9BASI|nr:hypothetical protein CBOM_00979 [Ceraceosorus bombacis]